MKTTIKIFLLIAVLFQIACGHSASRIEQERLLVFSNAPEENLAPTKWEYGVTAITNELRLDLFERSISGLKGGYFGVGSFQNFILAAWADSEWIWIMDFTRAVARINKIHIAFFKNAVTVEEFKSLWSEESKDKAMEILNREYAKDPDLKLMPADWKSKKVFIHYWFLLNDSLTARRNYKTLLNDPVQYKRIRDLAQKGNIVSLKGDLNGKITMKGIADNAVKMKIPIRVMYFSNAEEYFPVYVKDFRDNIVRFPIDEKSVAIRTVSAYQNKFSWAPESKWGFARTLFAGKDPTTYPDYGYNYNTMKASVFASWMSSANPKVTLYDLMIKCEINHKEGTSRGDVFVNP